MRPEPGLELQGRYQLVERIALGGMGEVWRATDLRSGRAVAAKVLRPELAGDELFLARLRAETRNSRGLRHPNLAVVLDAGERNGSGWIIMELVHGRALSDVLAERGTMPPAEILPILAQTARALQVVHDSGVVHRDVKPANILITREGLAKLTDFGISTAANQLPMTAEGMVMGTAQYLAPEQAMGNPATSAGDLYSLGIIAYEALAGRRPFTGVRQVDIAFAHVNEEVPALPARLPPEVREVVMELLSKKPAERPRCARDLARRLDRIVVNLPVDAWEDGADVTWNPVRRAEAGRAGRRGPAPAAARVDTARTGSARAPSPVTAGPGGHGPTAPAGSSSSPTGPHTPHTPRTRAVAAMATHTEAPRTRHAAGSREVRATRREPGRRLWLLVLVIVLIVVATAVVGTLASAQPAGDLPVAGSPAKEAS